LEKESVSPWVRGREEGLLGIPKSGLNRPNSLPPLAHRRISAVAAGIAAIAANKCSPRLSAGILDRGKMRFR